MSSTTPRQPHVHPLPRPWRWRRIAQGVVAVAFAPLTALAQVSGLEDLNRRSESSASRELQQRGYVMSHRAAAQGSSYWEFWWSAARSQCVRVAVNGGQVTQLIGTDPNSCRRQPSHASSGSGTNDLENQRVDHATRELSRRGYVMSQQVAQDGGVYWQYWWNAAISRCVSMAVEGGQVTQMITADSRLCHQPSSGGPGSGWGSSTDDVVNRSVDQAGREMSRRGYVFSHEVAAQGSSYWQFWWNAASSQCLRLAVNGGRVTQQVRTDAGSCNRTTGGGSPGWGSGTDDLVNRGVDYAGREMSRRGYVYRSQVAAQGSSYWQFWWHPASAQCMRMAVNDARVTQLIRTDAGSCDQRQGGGWSPASTKDDLVYQGVDYAQRELPRRGYVLMQTEQTRGGGYWQYWWTYQRAECLRLAVNDGRVTQATPVDRRECRQ